MAAYAVHELTIEVDKGSSSFVSIAGLETADININGEVKDWNDLGNGGWKSRLLTGKDIEVSLSGKRVEGDAGNDYISMLVDEVTTGATSTLKITWPNGDILSMPCVIDVSTYGGGNTTDVGNLEFSCLSNGKPTFTGFSA
jgi:predicted secreted protein